MAATQEEHVLVVPRSVFEGVGHFQGFQAGADAYLPVLLDPRNTSYRPRAAVEEDPSFKQLIPYCVLAWRGPDGVRRFFAYTRGGGGGEARLRAKRSLGIGGHISTLDGAHGDDASYEAGMRRELDEEVGIGGRWTARCVGLINDDATPVGSVHLGVVHVLDLERPEVTPREAELLDGAFSTLDELLADRDRFETWSQITLDAIRAGLLA